MPGTAIDRLLHELDTGFVVPERYSRRSACGRVEPLFRTTALAVIALLTSVVLGRSAPPKR